MAPYNLANTTDLPWLAARLEQFLGNVLYVRSLGHAVNIKTSKNLAAT
jgi:hypothetical protein